MKVHGDGNKLTLAAETASDERALDDLLSRPADAGDALVYAGDRHAVEVFGMTKPAVARVPAHDPEATLTGAFGFGSRQGLIRNRLKARVVRAAVEKGHTAAEAEQAFEDGWASSDRPFIDWFVNGGFEKLLEIVLNLLKLFAESK